MIFSIFSTSKDDKELSFKR